MNFFSRLFRSRQINSDLSAELRSHLDEKTAELLASGMSRREAELSARRQFGNSTLLEERAREVWRRPTLESFIADFRFALRMVRKKPGFTAVAILTLALGIGANTAIFSVVNAILLKSLPVQRPQELVVLKTSETGKDPSYAFSFNTFQTLQRESHSLAGLAASASLRMNVEIAGQYQPPASGQMVSGNYYAMLGVPAAQGRVLFPADDSASTSSAVAVLSYGYWERQFARNPNVIGQIARLNGQPFTIIGVSAPEFFGTHVGAPADITVPLATQPRVNADFGTSLISGQGADDFWLELIGRLRADTPVEAAQAETNGIFQRILPQILRNAGGKAKLIGRPHVEIEPGSRGLSELRRRFSRPLLVLMAVVALVLVLSCANVANLLLARAASRRREIAVRVSLGASHGRLIRQLLTEAMLLAGAGGAAGLVIADWSRRALSGLIADGNSFSLQSSMDFRVLLFTFGASVLTGFAFGIVPAFNVSHVDALSALKEAGNNATAGSRRFAARGILVAVQVAVSAALLVGASLFIRTLANLKNLDLGYDQEHILALRLESRGSNQKHQNGVQLMQLYGGLLDRVRVLPRVRAVSLAGSTPLTNESALSLDVAIPGYAPRAGEDMHVRVMQVYPDYFSTLGVPLLAGRDLSPADNSPQLLNDVSIPLIVVVNETLAKRFFGGSQSAVGRQFKFGCCEAFQIAGVARDVRDRALREEVTPVAYCTYAQTPTGRGQMTLLVRVAGDPESLIASIPKLAREIDPAMPLLGVEPLSVRVAAATQQERLVAMLSTLFGALALTLAASGLYGVVSYTVTQRSAEFGVRLALGASPGRVERLVLRQSLALVSVGIAAGIAIAAAGARAITHSLFGVTPFDPLSFCAASAILLIAGAVAAYLPARHAAKMDPIAALRHE